MTTLREAHEKARKIAGLHPWGQAIADVTIDHYLTAMAAQGFKMVPREPEKGQWGAAVREFDNTPPSKRVLLRAWEAMYDAAPSLDSTAGDAE